MTKENTPQPQTSAQTGELWQITLKIYRHQEGGESSFNLYPVQIYPEETVLDAVEKVWAFQDRSLVFNHACHHSTCGACGMRVNGYEKLTCITPIHEVSQNGGTITLEPLRNFPPIADLAVDLRPLYARMAESGHRPVLPVKDEYAPGEEPAPLEEQRLADCIECGLCISVCPASVTASGYLGPAVLAGAQQKRELTLPVCALVDNQDGVWRCHSAFECSEVCPSHVDPAARIMDLRRRLITRQIRRLFNLDR